MRALGVLLALLLAAPAPVHAQTVEETLHTERDKFGPTISPAEAHTILNATAWAHRFDCAPAPCWGLHRAPPGGNGFVRPDGTKVRNDILVGIGSGRIYDVFIDGPDSTVPNHRGRAEVNMREGAVMADGVFVAPMPPSGSPVQPQPDPPVPVDLGPIRTALEQLRNDVKALTDLSAWLETRLSTNERVDGEQATAINQLGAKVAALETLPVDPPDASKNFFGWLFGTKEGIAMLGGIGTLVGGLIVKLQPQPAMP